MKDMNLKRVELEQKWLHDEVEGSKDDLYALLEDDETILNMVLKDRKPISQTLDRRFKEVRGVAEIANSPGKRICELPNL